MNLLKSLLERLSWSAFNLDAAFGQNYPEPGAAPASLQEIQAASDNFCTMIEMQNAVMDDLKNRYQTIHKDLSRLL